MDTIYLILSTLLFLGEFCLAVGLFRAGRRGGTPGLLVMAAGFVFQCLFLWERGQLHGRCPITNGAEILIFISWSIVIMYFVLGRAFRLSLLGLFTAPIVFVFQAVALLLLVVGDPGASPVAEVDPWLEMHASMSLLAYGAFGLAAVAGVMYLLQNRQLKSRHPGRLSRRLPPVKYLADALVRLLLIGLVLITAGIVSAFFMETVPSPLHLTAFGAVWLVYGLVLLVHLVRRLSPRSLAFGAMGAFALAVVTLSIL